MKYPGYVIKRVRRTIPLDCGVIPGSTPVVSFGNAHTARVATLGINPSRGEFLDRSGVLLTGGERRLATYESIKARNLSEANDNQIRQIVSGCYNYFSLNPYRWFNDLEQLMNHAAGASYYDGSACHLDLVQWATDPNWGDLPRSARKQLLLNDEQFLIEQLKNEHIKLVLLNGRSVIKQVERIGVKIHEDYAMNFAGIPCRIVVGSRQDTIFVGWSKNLQSSHGITKEFKLILAEHVRQIVSCS